MCKSLYIEYSSCLTYNDTCYINKASRRILIMFTKFNDYLAYLILDCLLNCKYRYYVQFN